MRPTLTSLLESTALPAAAPLPGPAVDSTGDDDMPRRNHDTALFAPYGIRDFESGNGGADGHLSRRAS